MPFRICVLFGDDELGYRFLPPYPYVQKKNVSPRGWYNADTNKTFEFMKETGPVDYFVITQDDSEFVLPGWGPWLLDILHSGFQDGQGVVEFFNPSGFSNYISRASVFDQFDGKLLDERCKHYFSDSMRRQELIDRGQFTGLNYHSPLDIVSVHPTYATVDPTGLEAREKWFDRDKAIYEEWVRGRQG